MDWGEVYRATWEDLVRFLHYRVWDEERARDLAQEAFVRALAHQPEDPRAWLFSVAVNLARDEARAAVRRRRHLTLLRAEARSRAPEEPEGPERLERAEREERVRSALETLGDRDREVLLLWDAGLSYREIARQTGLAVGAIGTTLARARRRLVEAYESAEDERDHVARQ
ncbi:MAG: RNA polymerase sigma factor [Gemmatimonadota bacterium]